MVRPVGLDYRHRSHLVVLLTRAVGQCFVNSEGEDRYLSTMSPGDFFGEIAALSGAQRTANVVAEDASTLLQVRAETLRTLMGNPALSALFLSTMSERLNRTTINELPRFAGPDPQMLRDLRTAPVEG